MPEPLTYQESGGADKCLVTNMKLPNGRTQSFFRCANGANVTNTFEFSVVTGPHNSRTPFRKRIAGQKSKLTDGRDHPNLGHCDDDQ